MIEFTSKLSGPRVSFVEKKINTNLISTPRFFLVIVIVPMWRSVLSIFHVGCRDWTQAVQLAMKHLYVLRPLTIPKYNSFLIRLFIFSILLCVSLGNLYCKFVNSKLLNLLYKKKTSEIFFVAIDLIAIPTLVLDNHDSCSLFFILAQSTHSLINHGG